MTATSKPAAALDLAQFEGHTPKEEYEFPLTEAAQDVPGTHLSMQDFRDEQAQRLYRHGCKMEADRAALLAECRRMREQLAECDGYAAALRYATRIAVLESDRQREIIDKQRSRLESERAVLDAVADERDRLRGQIATQQEAIDMMRAKLTKKFPPCA